jgi:hypothetical protein
MRQLATKSISKMVAASALHASWNSARVVRGDSFVDNFFTSNAYWLKVAQEIIFSTQCKVTVRRGSEST